MKQICSVRYNYDRYIPTQYHYQLKVNLDEVKARGKTTVFQSLICSKAVSILKAYARNRLNSYFCGLRFVPYFLRGYSLISDASTSCPERLNPMIECLPRRYAWQNISFTAFGNYHYVLWYCSWRLDGWESLWSDLICCSPASEIRVLHFALVK